MNDKTYYANIISVNGYSFIDVMHEDQELSRKIAEERFPDAFEAKKRIEELGFEFAVWVC
jgi:hypothetical protein